MHHAFVDPAFALRLARRGLGRPRVAEDLRGRRVRHPPQLDVFRTPGDRRQRRSDVRDREVGDLLGELKQGLDPQRHRRHDTERSQMHARACQPVTGELDPASRGRQHQLGDETCQVAVNERAAMRARRDRSGDRLRGDRSEDRQREAFGGKSGHEIAQPGPALHGRLAARTIDRDTGEAVERHPHIFGCVDPRPGVRRTDDADLVTTRRCEQLGNLGLRTRRVALRRSSDDGARPVREAWHGVIST